MGTLWYNGTIYTMENEGETVEAVYTKNGEIVNVGRCDELEHQYKHTIVERMNLEGKAVYPGFVDSHIHLIGFGETFIRLDLSSMKSKQEVLQAVRERAHTTPIGEWIIGEGWNENLWTDPTVINRIELDLVAPNHPVVLKRVCRHAIVVNSNALRLAGVDQNTENPSGGVIEKNKVGDIHGIIKDTAQDLITSIMPVVSNNYLNEALRAGIENCWKMGLVGVHTEDLGYYGGFSRTFQAFKRVIEEENKKFRAHLLVHHHVIEDWYKETNGVTEVSDLIEFGAMKIFIDGALGGHTALLSHPYADDPDTNGVMIHELPELIGLVQKARQYKLPIATHVIGDLAFEHMINIISEIPAQNEKRDRLIHAQILRKELIDRARGLPVILDIQPRFVASDFPWVVDRVGKDNTNYIYAWKTLLEEGIHCAGGSDSPIEPADPLLGIHAAVTRTNSQADKKMEYLPEQKLSMFEAISLFTTGSAFACNHEHDRGLIKKGFLADFTILNQDLFHIDNDSILKTIVEMTVIGGEVVYENRIGVEK
jgi:predicted amidohydrolase YtcJ